MDEFWTMLCWTLALVPALFFALLGALMLPDSTGWMWGFGGGLFLGWFLFVREG